MSVDALAHMSSEMRADLSQEVRTSGRFPTTETALHAVYQGESHLVEHIERLDPRRRAVGRALVASLREEAEAAAYRMFNDEGAFGSNPSVMLPELALQRELDMAVFVGPTDLCFDYLLDEKILTMVFPRDANGFYDYQGRRFYSLTDKGLERLRAKYEPAKLPALWKGLGLPVDLNADPGYPGFLERKP
tara:strand:+ start:171 stop:740 length:570 start_codon:yes stop_codon:yes gene_type:complete